MVLHENVYDFARYGRFCYRYYIFNNVKIIQVLI